MRKRGILNAELNAAISRLGHTDVVVVVDCGTPAPAGVPVVDLAVRTGEATPYANVALVCGVPF